jgi:hypothetical protein
MSFVLNVFFMSRIRFSRFSFRALCVFGLFLLSLRLTAQPPTTLRIPLSSPDIVVSENILFQNAVYRYVVSGRGLAGEAATVPRALVDGRFFLQPFAELQGVARPKMPLDDNGMIASAFCASFAPFNSPCNVYLAVNLARPPALPPGSVAAAQSPDFRAGNALDMKRFAFVPDNDAFSPDGVYAAMALGANLPAQAVFVDRRGFDNNSFYADNEDTLRLRVERQSPELVFFARPAFAVSSVQPPQILNDLNPLQPFSFAQVNFGSFRPGSPLQMRRIVLYNRGIEPLSVRLKNHQNPTSPFSVSSPSGALDGERFLARGGDSLELFLTYQPAVAGEQTLDVRIITNDPAIATGGRQGEATLRLVGATGGGVLLVTGQMGQFVADTLFFGVSRADTELRTFPQIARNFNFSRAITVQERFSIDAAFITPGSVFSFLNFPTPDPLTLLPIDIEPPPSFVQFTSTMTFRPTAIGDYVDSMIISGRNLETYKMFFRGRAELASASLTRAQPPMDSDTLDLGAFPSGGSAAGQILVRNTGNLPLNMQAFASASPNGGANDPSEFTITPASGFISARTGETLPVSIRYTASATGAAGQREIYVFVIARDDDGAIAAQRRFVVRARRLPTGLAAARAEIRFDSVYAGAVASDTTLLLNVSSQFSVPFSFTLNRQSITPLSASAAEAFAADTLGLSPISRRFAPGSSGVAGFRFKPQRRGADSADFQVSSVVDSTGGVETIAVRLRGVGVEQKFDLQAAVADSLVNNSQILPVEESSARGFRVFTVSLGCVRLGLPRTVRFAFRNNGNIPFVAWNQFRVPSGNAPSDAAFTIVQPFALNRAVPIDGVDTSLAVRFLPSALGEQRLEYVLQSDIRRAGRVPTAPESAEQIILVIRAVGVAPSLSVRDTLRFEDNPLGSQCAVQSSVPLMVSNDASPDCGAPLLIRRAIIATPNTPFRLLSDSLSLVAQPGASVSITVQFSPNFVGEYSATLLLITDAPSPLDTARVVLFGRAVNQPSVRIAAPRGIRASPGGRVEVPIFVKPAAVGSPSLNAQALQFVKIVNARVSFDASLLAYVDATTLGTASEGADVRVAQSLSGGQTTLDITISARDTSFRTGADALVKLNFNTYLGRRAATELAFAGLRLGDEACARAQITEVENGSFELDSVCGLQAKVAAVGATTFRLTGVTPNPAGSSLAKISFQTAYFAHVRVELLDARGQSVETIVEGDFPEGAFEGELDTTRFPPGVYFCRMQAGRFNDMQKIVIRR